MLIQLWQICDIIGLILIIANGQISNHLVTLIGRLIYAGRAHSLHLNLSTLELKGFFCNLLTYPLGNTRGYSN